MIYFFCWNDFDKEPLEQELCTWSLKSTEASLKLSSIINWKQSAEEFHLCLKICLSRGHTYDSHHYKWRSSGNLWLGDWKTNTGIFTVRSWAGGILWMTYFIFNSIAMTNWTINNIGTPAVLSLSSLIFWITMKISESTDSLNWTHFLKVWSLIWGLCSAHEKHYTSSCFSVPGNPNNQYSPERLLFTTRLSVVRQAMDRLQKKGVRT